MTVNSSSRQSTTENAHVAGTPKTISLPRLLAFAGGPLKASGWPMGGQHTDSSVAKDAGLRAPLVEGTQVESLLIGFLVESFGAGWFSGSRLEVKYIKPVIAGSTVTPHLIVVEELPEGGSACEVWCENENAEKVLVGTAFCPGRIEAP
jgi:MaoC like domain